jgi:hypothetical protein
MERLVVTLETAKKLKAAGFPQVTHFQWWQSSMGYNLISDKRIIEFEAAPTAQEIADQLPGGLQPGHEPNWLSVQKMFEDKPPYIAGYLEQRSNDNDRFIDYARADTMAEALALLWLKLQEEK